MYSRGAHFGNYPLHLSISMAIALLLVIACFKLPLRQKPRPVGWSNQALSHSEGFSLVGVHGEEAGPITSFSEAKQSEPVAEPHEDPADEPDLEDEIDSTAASITRKNDTQKLPVLEHAELMPAIPGGIGAYYVHIEYPEEAIQQGIEGLLQLTFTVNTDGSTSNIEVTRPLHPLCDSAAVQALRRTAFIPGQHDGRSVRVRMRLPVRFELIEPAAQLSKLSSEETPQ